ncbi:Hypothetical protein AA314_07433 [Archangium gephyra]|uniref:Uncharacterized protein n=1 Tax=Archangium gephyra TaxID=48 RepID=A0AAC8TH27_9BACT|nr:Hypothetical protein AA314_07433 [Archangium gephyra]
MWPAGGHTAPWGVPLRCEADGDFSRWIRQVLRDDELAREVSAIEHRYELPAADSRRQVLGAITHRYALPA